MFSTMFALWGIVLYTTSRGLRRLLLLLFSLFLLVFVSVYQLFRCSVEALLCCQGPMVELPTQYITALTKPTPSIKNTIIWFQQKPVRQTRLWGHMLSSSDMVSHTPALFSTNVTLWHWRPWAKAGGRIACKCTGHPLACHCVIRQKIRPNSWVLRTLLPHFLSTMHHDARAHTNAHIHKCIWMIY